MHARLVKLKEAWVAAGLDSWVAVHGHKDCRDAAEWLIKSVWAPNAPDAVPLGFYAPSAPGSEILDALCKRWKVPE